MTFPFIRPLKHYQFHQQLIEIFMIDIGLMGLVKKKISYLRLELEYIQIGTLLMVISVFHLKENNIHFMHPKD